VERVLVGEGVEAGDARDAQDERGDDDGEQRERVELSADHVVLPSMVLRPLSDDGAAPDSSAAERAKTATNRCRRAT
jgi:hypothetical protein